MSTITCTVTDPQEIQPGNLVQYCKDEKGNIIHSDGFPCVKLATVDTVQFAGIFIKMENGKAVVQVSNIDKRVGEE